MNINEARHTSSEWFKDRRVKKALLQHMGIGHINPQDMEQALRDPSVVDQARSDYLIVSNPSIYDKKHPVPARSIDIPEVSSVLDADPLTDIGFSLRDGLSSENAKPREVKLFWDIESYDVHNPWRQLFDQMGFFRDMEESYVEVAHVLESYGIPYLSTMTGRGYHIMTSVSKDTPVFQELLELGKNIEPAVLEHQAKASDFSKQKFPLPPEFEQLQRSATFLQQFVFLKAMQSYRTQNNPMPVDISDNGSRGVAYDNTVALRHAGTAKYSGPGSPYIKPFLFPYKFGGEGVIDQTPLLFRVIKESEEGKRTLPELIAERQDRDRAAGNLSEMGARIPMSAPEGIRHLLADYKSSPLYTLQQQLEAYGDLDPQDQWPRTYRNYEAITKQYPQLSYIISECCPRLLQPDPLRHLILTFAESGWPPIHIAGFLHAAFTDPAIDWGRQFERHNPRMRHATGWVYLVLSEALMRNGPDPSQSLQGLIQP